MKTMSVKDKLATGRLMAVRKAPYLASAIGDLVPVEMPGLGTFGVTERSVMYYDPVVVEAWTVEEICGVIVHEVNHPVRDHAGRCRRIQAEGEIGNIGGDYEINDDLRPMGLALPGEPLYPEQAGLEPGLTLEEYVRALLDQRAEQDAGDSPDGDSGSQGDEDGDGSGDSDPDENQADSGDDSGSGDGDDAEPGDGDSGQQGGGDGDGQEADGDGGGSSEGGGSGEGDGDGGQGIGSGSCGGAAGNPRPFEAELDRVHGRSDRNLAQTRRAVAEAVQREASTGRGNVPGGLVRWAEVTLQPPKIPWRQKLARAVRLASAYRAGAVDRTYSKVSRRQGGIGYGAGRPVVAALHAPVPRVAVIVDTSGSMGSDELRDALAETGGVLKAVGGDVSFVACDTDAHGVHRVSNPRQLPELLEGGGGTDMTPAFEAVAREREPVDVIVCITDGYIGNGYPSREPDAKVIWVVVGGYDGEPAPYGDTVRVED